MERMQQAEDFVFELFKDKLSTAYTYHNFNHTLRVVHAVEKLLEKAALTKTDQDALLLAAWFHDAGYVDGPDNHERNSIKLLEVFARQVDVDPDVLALSKQLIAATEVPYVPQTLAERIIRDADCSHFGDAGYLDLSELLREEWRQTLQKHFSDLEWARGNRDLLLHKHRYHTEYARKKWQPVKEANIAALQVRISTLEQDLAKADKKEKKSKEEKPDRGIETMFRTTLSNHVQLSQIADSKANILLSVNAIIISIALSTLIPKLDSPGNAHLIMPTFIMVLFSVVSIVFAILSTRPKVTPGVFTRKDVGERNINLLFFWEFLQNAGRRIRLGHE